MPEFVIQHISDIEVEHKRNPMQISWRQADVISEELHPRPIAAVSRVV